MNPKLKIFLYGLCIFAIYIVILIILRLTTGNFPEDVEFFGFFTRNDIFLGLIVAVILTLSHLRRRKLK